MWHLIKWIFSKKYRQKWEAELDELMKNGTEKEILKFWGVVK